MSSLTSIWPFLDKSLHHCMYFLLKHCELLHDFNEKYFFVPSLLEERISTTESLESLCDPMDQLQKPTLRCFPLKQMTYIHFSSIIGTIHEYISKLPATFKDGNISITKIYKDCLTLSYTSNDDTLIGHGKISFHYPLSCIMLVVREYSTKKYLFCVMSQLLDEILKSPYFTRTDPPVYVSFHFPFIFDLLKLFTLTYWSIFYFSNFKYSVRSNSQIHANSTFLFFLFQKKSTNHRVFLRI